MVEKEKFDHPYPELKIKEDPKAVPCFYYFSNYQSCASLGGILIQLYDYSQTLPCKGYFNRFKECMRLTYKDNENSYKLMLQAHNPVLYNLYNAPWEYEDYYLKKLEKENRLPPSIDQVIHSSSLIVEDELD
mmetsp:Transcript_7856/g.11655  ORF Transcript_7856/g.11655 Transcript_7856/m.11655 type:complete len:132 (-) Transcript_7856:50-445(-)